MQIIVYSHEGGDHEIWKTAFNTFPRVDLVWSMETLREMLRQPSDDTVVAVLIAHTNDELESLLRIRSLLRDARLILLLPDREAETVAKGHLLQPRFLSCTGGDPGEVTLVLKKMLSSLDGEIQ